MKKVIIMCCFFVLSACALRAGEYNFLPIRNELFESLFTYPITYYDQSMRPVKSELLTERAFPEGVVLSATVGYSVVDDKTYRKVYYAKEVLSANEDGGLASGGMPVIFKKHEQVEMIGEVTIDDQRYALASTGEGDFVILVDANGNLYKKIGQIRNDRLALLNSVFVVNPRNFAFEPVTLSKTVQTSPIKGFDIKYGGLKAGYVTFIYYKFDVPNNDGLHDSGDFEVLSYQNKPSIINIKGVKLRIIEAREESLDYMIIEE